MINCIHPWFYMTLVKAGFHLWWSPSRSQFKSAYNQVKIKNWSCKQSHKLDRMELGGSKHLHFPPILIMTLLLMIQWKLHCQSWWQNWKRKPITMQNCRQSDTKKKKKLLVTPNEQCSFHQIWGGVQTA